MKMWLAAIVHIMMSDLISRQAVMDYLREQQAGVIIEKTKQNAVTYEVCKGMESSIEAFMNFINQVPAAYDVDKVVEQLENKIFSAEVYNDDFNGVQIGNLLCMGDVHEIVKAGGEGE